MVEGVAAKAAAALRRSLAKSYTNTYKYYRVLKNELHAAFLLALSLSIAVANSISATRIIQFHTRCRLIFALGNTSSSVSAALNLYF